MKRFLLTCAAAALLLSARAAQGQPIDVTIDHYHYNPALRVGQSFELKQGETARQVVVIGGDAIIDGTVDRDIVVVLGRVELQANAIVEGALVTVGGNVKIAPGARVRREMFVLGGLDSPPGFVPGGDQIVIGTAGLGSALSNLVPWLTRGVLLGRPIVPGLGWVWWVAGTFFLLNLLLNLLFDGPIRAATATMRATPMTSFMTGLLMLLLFGPVCVLLAISVVGVAVIPFLLCAMLIAAVLGKIAFARWIGMTIVAQEDPEDRLQSVRSFLIGSAVMCIAYMIPVVGLVTWAMAAVFGLGASTLAFHAAYRRENPKKPKPVKPAAAPPINPDLGSGSPGGPGPQAGEPVPQPVLSSALNLRPEAGSYVTAPIQPERQIGPDEQLGGPQVLAAGPSVGLLALPRAVFVERLAAFTLDFILIVIVAQVLDLDRNLDAPLGRAGMLLAIAYHVGFWTWKGTTLGGIITNLRVVRTDGRPLQFAEALVRGLTGIFSLAVIGLGFFWILRDPEKQAWHDRVAGTYVVKVPRDYPI